MSLGKDRLERERSALLSQLKDVRGLISYCEQNRIGVHHYYRREAQLETELMDVEDQLAEILFEEQS